MGANSRCPIQFVLCGWVALFQLAEFLFEPREFRLLARDGTLCVVQCLGEGHSCAIEVVEVSRVAFGGGHAGGTRRGRAGGVEDTCEGWVGCMP